MFKSLIIAGIAAVATISSVNAGTLDKIRESKTITIGQRDANIPFSYFNDRQESVGYGMEICQHVISAVKNHLNLPELKVEKRLVTSANRIPFLTSNTIDMECGSGTNTLERQKSVDFSPTVFVVKSTVVFRRDSGIKRLTDLRDRTVVGVAGTTNIKHVVDFSKKHNLNIKIVTVPGRAEAFLMVANKRADAMTDDDILLAGLVARSKDPKEFVVSDEALQVPEPYGFMMRKNDPEFKKIVDQAIGELYKSGKINEIYRKWFMSTIPPGINLNMPISAGLKKAYAKPTNSADPANYQ